VLAFQVQSHRNIRAAKRFLRKLTRRWGLLRVLVTDKLRSERPRDRCPSGEHRSYKGLNNRIEASHRPTLRREEIMSHFESTFHAQSFLLVHGQTAAIFRAKRHRISAISYRNAWADAFSLWNENAEEMTA